MSGCGRRGPSDVTQGIALRSRQDPAERLLVSVIFFPAAKVADVPLIAEVHRPGLVALHHRLIDPDGKEHELPAALLLGERLADLVLHPILAMAFFERISSTFGRAQVTIAPLRGRRPLRPEVGPAPFRCTAAGSNHNRVAT